MPGASLGMLFRVSLLKRLPSVSKTLKYGHHMLHASSVE